MTEYWQVLWPLALGSGIGAFIGVLVANWLMWRW